MYTMLAQPTMRPREAAAGMAESAELIEQCTVWTTKELKRREGAQRQSRYVRFGSRAIRVSGSFQQVRLTHQ